MQTGDGEAGISSLLGIAEAGGGEEMSEKKGLFDRVIVWIKQKLESLEEENQRYGTDDFASWINEYRAAIRVLEDWPKWKPLIEVAGKVDKAVAIEHFHIQVCPEWEDGKRERIRVGVLAGCPKCVVIDDLLEALPDKEEK